MKIHQLPLGARFEYEGEEYTKTGPMFATGPAGQKLIPKYAVLKPLGDYAASEPQRSEAALPRAAVLRAFERFYQTCETLVPAAQRPALAAARQAFVQSLGSR